MVNEAWGCGGDLEAAFQRSVFNFEPSLVVRGKASLSRFVVSSFLLLVFHTRPGGGAKNGHVLKVMNV